jgi:hypothetical protein
MGVRGEAVVKAVFGGSLYQQGRGFYVALELFAIVRGSLLAEAAGVSDQVLVLPAASQETQFCRPTHDFARRLMAGDFVRRGREHELPMSTETADSLQALLLGLQAPVPGRRSPHPDWRKWHLYPYPPDFVHYDALDRRNRINIERDSYRGGGGLAHRILREDGDEARLQSTRAAFRTLLQNADSPLGELARALHDLDQTRQVASEPWKDSVEGGSEVRDSPWVEQLREGVHRILTRPSLSAWKRTDALMYWAPFCIARHQQSLSFARLAETANAGVPVATTFDCQPSNNPIRDRARREFLESTQAVYRALQLEAKEQERHELLRGGQGWSTGPRTFFATTMYAVGAANASTGIRWFTANPELLESIVLAKLDAPVPFDRFCKETLWRDLGMVVDRWSAHAMDISDIDQSTFEANAEGVAEALHDLGLLERYSDMTRMVGVNE